MKAAVLQAVGQPLVLAEVPLPTLGPDDVLVQTRACGICGTDLHMHAGWGYQPALPFVMGHEPSGVVAAVGANVRRVRVGERVVVNIFYACGDCFYCRTDRETQCTQLGGILGVLTHWGGYGEYFRVPARQVFALPEAISFAEGAVIADAVVTAVHAVQRGRVAPGERVAVLGVGGCGSAVLQIAQLYGAAAIGVDQSEAKRAHALALGAAAAVNGQAVDPVAAVREWAGGAGVQCVIDTVGSAASVPQALGMLARGGRLVILGYTQDRPALDPRQVAVNELEIIGTRSGGRQCTAEAIRLVADPRWRPIVTDTFPIGEVNAALEHLRSGAALGRIVLTFEA
jgi:alcohol dehydrogenase, propanol-preferring